MTNIDALDQAILTLLHQDARVPSAQIARQLGESPRTVQHRIQRLIEQGVIQPVGVVNPSSFGYSLAVDIFCELEVGSEDQALQAILDMPNVTYVALSTGDQDISLQAIFKNSADMQEFITHKLHQVPGMRRTRTVLIPQILKDTHQWLPSEADFNSAGNLSGSA
jgi:Lrp/AsnC family transcriptional regulator for asnA, asnC and gidA